MAGSRKVKKTGVPSTPSGISGSITGSSPGIQQGNNNNNKTPSKNVQDLVDNLLAPTVPIDRGGGNQSFLSPTKRPNQPPQLKTKQPVPAKEKTVVDEDFNLRDGFDVTKHGKGSTTSDNHAHIIDMTELTVNPNLIHPYNAAAANIATSTVYNASNPSQAILAHVKKIIACTERSVVDDPNVDPVAGTFDGLRIIKISLVMLIIHRLMFRPNMARKH